VTHTIAEAENGRLADEPLFLADIFDRHSVDLASHVLVDVTAVAKRLEQVSLPGYPSQDASLDAGEIRYHQPVVVLGDYH